MAPLVLKVKGNKTFLPFSTLSSEDELSQTWRVCTKVKDSLENGSRLENLSWRLWFRQQLLTNSKKNTSQQFRRLSISTARKLSSHVSLLPLKELPIKQEGIAAMVQENFIQQQKEQEQQLQQQIQQQQQQLLLQQQLQQQQSLAVPVNNSLMNTNSFYGNNNQQQQQGQGQGQNNYTLPQFTSDQSSNEIVELDDIFSAFNNEFNIPTNADMGMADGWDFGIPSPTNPYYSPTQTTSTPALTLQHPTSTVNDTASLTTTTTTTNNNATTTSPNLFGYDISPQQTNLIPSNEVNNNSSSDAAMYVSGSSMPPPPTATLRNKILGNMQGQLQLQQQFRFNSSSQGFNTGGFQQQTPPMSASNSASTIASTNSIQMGGLMDDISIGTNM